MDRTRDLSAWPHAAASRFVRHGTIDWHVQELGDGPPILLLHGAGASTHTWRDVAPLLARQWRVIALDLPGQGFTRTGNLHRTGLDAMSEDIATLCHAEGLAPRAIIGHSAGAAIALSLARVLPGAPAVIGVNAALGHFRGIASWLFPLLARLLALNPLTATVFTLGGPSVTRAGRLIEGTGSRLDDRGLRLYAALIGDRAQVDATLQMMTRWRIDPLLARLSQIGSPVLLVVGTGDKAVPPETSDNAAARLSDAEVVRMPGLGHLAHEESPAAFVRIVEDFLRKSASRQEWSGSECVCE